METLNSKEVEIDLPKQKSGNAGKFKKAGCFAIIFIIFSLCCIGSLGTLWAGGWLKEAACDIVLEDSAIWEKVNCKQEKKEDAGSIEQGKVIDIRVSEEIQSVEDLVTEIIEQASPGVVTITIKNQIYEQENGYIDQEEGIGSGFVVDSEGIILTNQHVVSDEEADYSIIVPGKDEAIPVAKVYRDSTNDIAILVVEKNELKALKLGDSKDLKRGNLAIAIGSPFGDLQGTATIGYVTGLNRDVTAGSGFLGPVSHYKGVIQTDAAINPGNSGGPLLNSKGEVIGINFATTLDADNISFAIPIDQVKTRLEIFQEEGRFPQPYIGVAYEHKTIILEEKALIGALIQEVEKEGPADKAGVKKGDIILKVDGKNLTEYSLVEIIQSLEIGYKLEIEILRKDENEKVEVVVGDRGE